MGNAQLSPCSHYDDCWCQEGWQSNYVFLVDWNLELDDNRKCHHRKDQEWKRIQMEVDSARHLCRISFLWIVNVFAPDSCGLLQ